MPDNVIYGVDFQNPDALKIHRVERQLAMIRRLALELQLKYSGIFGEDTAPCEMNPDDCA
jgi:hypothetical protein